MPDDYGYSAAQSEYDRQEPPGDNAKIHCDDCGKGLFEGDKVFRIEGQNLCEDCVYDSYGWRV